MSVLIKPDSVIKAYIGVPITAGQTLTFKTIENQRAYFQTKLGKTYSNVSYVKRNGSFKVEDTMSSFGRFNYISFRNSSFENVEIYARIIDIEYVNNQTVEFQYEIDWFQTFMHDLEYGHAVVDREQLSQGAYNRALNNPTYFSKDDYQMISPEDLAVSQDMEKYYERSDVMQLPGSGNVIPDPVTGAMSDDNVIMFQIAPPSDFAEDEDLDVWLEILTKFDGIVDGHTTDKIPTTLLTGWINTDNFDNVLLSDTPENSASNRIKHILDQLTIMGATSSIVGMYVVPRLIIAPIARHYVFTGIGGQIGVREREGLDYARPLNISVSHPNEEGIHPKLNMFPFKYIRVVSPDGNEKEYKFEEFYTRSGADASPESGTVVLGYVGSINGKPSVTVVPRDYKTSTSPGSDATPREGGDPISSWNYNWMERIDYTNFPSVPFNTDNYLTYLSQQYLTAFATNNRIDNFLGQAGDVINIGRGVVSGATSGAVLGSMGGPVGTAVGGALGAANTVISGGTSNTMGMIRRNKTIEEANEVRGDLNKANESMYNNGRRAFATTEHHAGDGNFLNYIFNPLLAFNLYLVDMKDSIKQQYSNYFWNYGVNTNRQGKPLITNYMANITDPEKLPTFYTDPDTNETFTYAKTNGIVVYSPLAVVSEYVEDMFNTGYRFLKGD